MTPTATASLRNLSRGLRRVLGIAMGVLAIGNGTALCAEAVLQDTEEASAALGPFRFEPGADVPPLLIPRNERLVYSAYIDAAIFSTHVGTVTEICSVAQQAPSILVIDPAPTGEVASIKLLASGGYFGYRLESSLETRILPQEWPRISYNQVSKSSQTRRREILLGTKDGGPISSYRGDTKKGAPPGERILRPAKERKVPEGTLDMLTAVFQARTLIREKKDSISFPLIDTDRLWKLNIKRGEERRMETKAGVFDVVEVVLEPEPYPDEAASANAQRFQGVFGINGSIHLWVEKHTGVAVRIQGDLPIGDFMTLGIDVVLDSYTDTPEGFAPVQPDKDKKSAKK